MCVCMRVFFVRTVTYLHSWLSGPFPGHIDQLGFLVYRPTASLLTLRGDLGHLTRADPPECALDTVVFSSSSSLRFKVRPTPTRPGFAFLSSLLSLSLSPFHCRGRRSPLQ
ncbi:hypothetical protein K0M31_004303 [Melipona bicolor]|uniref:Uncharacterized protein n=1 Tax=Melipona bicolor TaxID=60889 RepID=A0AA40FWH8_9HYME|nr:hypothetical protein K0M31_004303 [Melipona bicolor]